MRLWFDNIGGYGEIMFIQGRKNGRQRVLSRDGDVVSEAYWIDDCRLTKCEYVAASASNPRLPKYDDIQQERESLKVTQVADSGKSLRADEIPIDLLRGPYVREARSWLRESNTPSRTLGESMRQSDALALVEKLYKAGAVSVHAVAIHGRPDENQNSGRLVVELPGMYPVRTSVMEVCAGIAEEAGFDPDPDVGQRYILLLLD